MRLRALAMLFLCCLAFLVARSYNRHVEEEACRRLERCGDGVGLLLRGNRDVCLCVRR